MNILDYIVKYWVLIAAVFIWSSSLAVGEYRIDSLEKAMQRQAIQGEKIHSIETNQAAIKEQLKSIDRNIQSQNQIQMQMFKKLFGAE